jgi:hypothetical protein
VSSNLIGHEGWSFMFNYAMWETAFGLRHSLIRERREHLRSRLPDMRKTFG